jgi:putative spermidine/putrescine transport system permease protein
MNATPERSKGTGPRRTSGTALLLGAYAAAVCVFLFAPIVIATVLSFSSAPQLIFPPPGYGLSWYKEALETRNYISGFWVSTIIATSTALISAVAGTGAAIAINHYRFVGRSAVQVLLMLPVALPGVVIGLNLLFTLPLYGMKTGMVATTFAHSLLGVSYVTYLVLATLANYDLTLEQASLNLGASRIQTFWRITFPLIRPGIGAGAAFAFLISFDNVALSIFTSGNDTLPLRLMQKIRFYPDPSVAAVAAVLVLLSLVVLLLFGKVLQQRDIGQLSE